MFQKMEYIIYLKNVARLLQVINLLCTHLCEQRFYFGTKKGI